MEEKVFMLLVSVMMNSSMDEQCWLKEMASYSTHCVFYDFFTNLIKNKLAISMYIMSFLHYFFPSDDLLEDSDSEEHSRSESVTGRLYLTCYICSSLEVKGEILLPDLE